MKQTAPDSILTERLQLRQFTEADWQPLHTYFSDTDATKHTVGRALTEGESWRALCSMIGHWQLRGYGPYAVVLKETGETIGIAGFWYPNDWPEPEIKWALLPVFWGKGYASEAARALQEVSQAMFERPLISFIHADNQSSTRLALAVGATLEKEVEFRGGRWQIYRHPLL